MRATRDGDLPAVQTVLRCPGVDVNVQDADNYGYTPLINAAKNGDRQMVQVRGINHVHVGSVDPLGVATFQPAQD